MFALHSPPTHSPPNEARAHLTPRDRVASWIEKFKEFNERKENICCDADNPIEKEHRQIYPTMSKYEGPWDSFGMNGQGVFTFPNGVKYAGGFKDNMFDGAGKIYYPDSNVVVDGIWFSGIISERELFLGGNILKYDPNTAWNYCKMPDRRFEIEYDNDIQPSYKSFLTNNWIPRVIPEGYYDTEEGFYNPITRFTYSYNDLTKTISKPDNEMHKWIIENCRQWNDDPVGPRMDLYEEFVKPLRVTDDNKCDLKIRTLSEMEAIKTREERMYKHSYDYTALREKFILPMFRLFNDPNIMNPGGTYTSRLSLRPSIRPSLRPSLRYSDSGLKTLF